MQYTYYDETRKPYYLYVDCSSTPASGSTVLHRYTGRGWVDVFVQWVDGQQPLVHPTGHQYSIFSALGCYVHHYALDGHRAHSTEKVILMSGQQHFWEHCTLGSM